ncbi:acetyltransferase [bacterium]|nr:acetyltransferase [bacterium]
MKSIILLGNGGHCKSCIDVIENSDEFQIKGIITKDKNFSERFMNYKILGNDAAISSSFDKDDFGLIAVGQIKSAIKRVLLFDLLRKNKIKLATVRSKNSLVSRTALLGEGTITMHNAIINSDAKIGMNCILNTNCLVEHDVTIGNHCHISTGVILNGGVSIGNQSFIGSGCVVKEGITIGDNVLVSAGQIVMKDLASNTLHKKILD